MSTQPFDQSQFAAQAMELLAALGGILDTVDGYRAQCAERGYSPTAAEQMAMELHSHLLRSALGGTSR